MNNKGILVVISGFSGAGKGTIMKSIMSKYEDKYALSISATTRSPREGETHGKEYFFLSTSEFEKLIEDDRLIEYASYVGNYYGTPSSFVEEKLAAGYNVILEIEIQGALKIKEKFPDTMLMFVTTKDGATLKERLIGRGTESLEVCQKRLSRAYEESLGIENYDYLVINDELSECVERVNAIISDNDPSKHQDNLIENNLDFIKLIREELLSFSKGE